MYIVKKLAGLSLSFLCVAALAQTPKDAPARLLSAEGKVEVARSGQAAWSAGVTNQTLPNGDRVRTGVRSRASIRLSDMTTMAVKELTTLEIRPPAAPGANNGFDLKSGGSYFFNRERAGTVEFRTPLASGAIRGTEFYVFVAENGHTEVALFDGEVEIANALGTLNLVSGEQGEVDPGQAPRKTAMLEASSIIQWVLYYPAIFDSDELGLSDGERNAFSDSLTSYRAGDLLAAQASYPDNRQPETDAERLYRAATLLSVGQVEQATQLVQNISSPLGQAFRQMVETVKGHPQSRGNPLTLASEWMAESYALQAQSKLTEALDAARKATAKSPNFGMAWTRVAELEFSFAHNDAAQRALEKSLALSPRNAQAFALSGFIYAGKGKFTAAEKSFDDAIALDPALANGWLGRGLVRIRRGHGAEGRQDLQVAATREPRRSMLRSYLGKAWSHTTDATRAQKELGLAKQFDPNDPTPWLYSALLNEQQNRVNDAVSDLEKSKELNDNRSVFRSRLLLDQDKAVRGANLARLYHDAGMIDWSFREASRAVSYDYANFSAHQFLANSYDALRDPKAINLRYEAPAASEYFIATLLSPVGATPLSQNVSQQEYTRLFEGDHFGVASSTEYFSNGDWIQQGSQYGRYGPVDYSLEGYYQYDNGHRPNKTVERTDFAGRFRAQLITKDTLYFEAQRSELESGDVVQYYNQSSASRKFRLNEVQEPSLFAGYHREWAPGVHTLFLGMRIEDDFEYSDPMAFIPFFKSTEGPITRILPTTDKVRVRSQFEGYSAELQQIFTTPMNTLILGGRLQYGTFDNFNAISNRTDVFGPFTTTIENETHLRRESVYAYDQWSPWRQLQLTVGVTYDRLDFPENNDTPPYTSTEGKEEKLSPKAGFIWTPEEKTHVRGAYTRSLGGVFFDNSRRLEPTQVGGFNQTYRSIAPESALGIAPATSFETFSLGVDHRFPTRTYVNLDAEWLRSDGDRTIGTLSNISVFPTVETTGRALQKIKYDERSIALSVNQLLGRDWAFGVRYRISEADSRVRFAHVSRALAGTAGVNRDDEALLQQLSLSLIYNLPCGFFAQAESIYTHQHFEDDLSDLAGEDLWQLNLFAGYRFWQRHAEARVGVLNVTDQDYRLHPLNLYSELPRERMFYASFKFYF
jgi:Flp pilus assembly protein TadD